AQASGEQILGRLVEQRFAETIAAVHRAIGRRVEEHPVPGAMGDARRRTVREIGERIDFAAARELAERGYRLTANGAARVLAVNQCRVVSREQEFVPREKLPIAGYLAFLNESLLMQFLGGAQGEPQLLLP